MPVKMYSHGYFWTCPDCGETNIHVFQRTPVDLTAPEFEELRDALIESGVMDDQFEALEEKLDMGMDVTEDDLDWSQAGPFFVYRQTPTVQCRSCGEVTAYELLDENDSYEAAQWRLPDGD